MHRAQLVDHASGIEIITLRTLKDNYSYIVRRSGARTCLVIDPSEAPPVLQAIREREIELKLILNTHHHHDHVGGNRELVEVYRPAVFCSERDLERVPHAECGLRDGETFHFDGIRIETLSIPGHTHGQIAFYLQESEAVFVGDTLFSLGCGRLFEGTPEQMWGSLQRLMALPDSTRLYFGHEYTESNGAFAQSVDPDNELITERLADSRQAVTERGIFRAPTLAEEMEVNPFLRASAPAIRKKLDLAFAHDVDVFARLRKMKDEFR